MRKVHLERRALIFVPYAEGEKLLRDGWTLAPEEDRNKIIGWVFLEHRGARP